MAVKHLAESGPTEGFHGQYNFQMREIPIIDLFAGPGGLGEGFSALRVVGKFPFRIVLSIEMDLMAHQTLELRAFFRKFRGLTVPEDYFRHLRGELTREALFDTHREQASAARREAWCAELGKNPPSEVKRRINEALGGVKDWVLIGGPPCQAYSLVGRSRRGGISSDDKRAYLYLEYLKIIADHSPPVFVMENVKGILSSEVAGSRIFDRILQDLAHPSRAIASRADGHKYRILSFVRSVSRDEQLDPEDYVIRAEQHGIPQARHRVILLGIRDDVSADRLSLLRLAQAPSVRDVIGDLPRLRSRLSKEPDSAERWQERILSELERVSASLVNGKVDAKTVQVMRNSTKGLVLTADDKYEGFVSGVGITKAISLWYKAPRLKGACNHLSRSHMASDLLRYLFCSSFAQVHGRAPNLTDFPNDFLPAHDNAKAAQNGGAFTDRFRVQVADKPATTVTSHIAKDGHYYIHYDPKQCRSLTVREAARIQTFPDDYFFCGGRTTQYHQVGNAVPPLLAREIARSVYRILEK